MAQLFQLAPWLEMENIVLQLSAVTKRYGGKAALQDISLSLRQGGIYGFIGRNGAGKTTLIRLITGLSFPDSGEILLFGKHGEKALAKQRKRVGCMIEEPVLYGGMTAQENLECIRLARGIPNRERICEALAMTGLADAGKKKVRHFSLGMRQRLGIAAALLGSPELLLLDEPMNGLDPIGITEMRGLLCSLARERGVTILISSHILDELYQLAAHFIIIEQGKIVEELTRLQLDERCKRHISLHTDHPPRTALLLEEALHTQNYKVLPGNRIHLYDYVDDAQQVLHTLQQGGIQILDFEITGENLENYFIHCIGGHKNA